MHQNRPTDQWNFYEARSIKRNMYEIAASGGGPKADDYRGRVKDYTRESAEIEARAKELEAQSEAALASSEAHERRHHFLTLATTLLHIAIAAATVAVVSGGARWPWLASLALGGLGTVVAAVAYLA